MIKEIKLNGLNNEPVKTNKMLVYKEYYFFQHKLLQSLPIQTYYYIYYNRFYYNINNLNYFI